MTKAGDLHLESASEMVGLTCTGTEAILELAQQNSPSLPAATVPRSDAADLPPAEIVPYMSPRPAPFSSDDHGLLAPCFGCGQDLVRTIYCGECV